jgi:hypothetical protein
MGESEGCNMNCRTRLDSIKKNAIQIRLRIEYITANATYNIVAYWVKSYFGEFNKLWPATIYCGVDKISRRHVFAM